MDYLTTSLLGSWTVSFGMNALALNYLLKYQVIFTFLEKGNGEDKKVDERDGLA